MTTTIKQKNFWKDLKSGQFESMVRESARGQMVNNSLELYNILKPIYAKDPDVEKVHFIFLDAKNNILSIDCLFQGTLSMAAVYPREIIKAVIKKKAAAVIMAHNHPAGDPTPSDADMDITYKTLLALTCIDVTMHEHIIIGIDKYHSMADAGVISELTRKAFNMLDINCKKTD